MIIDKNKISHLDLSKLNGEEIIIIKNSTIDKTLFVYKNLIDDKYKYLKDDGKYNINLTRLIHKVGMSDITYRKSISSLCIYKNDLRAIRFSKQICSLLTKSDDNFIRLNLRVFMRKIDGLSRFLPDYSGSYISEIDLTHILPDISILNTLKDGDIKINDLDDIYYPYINWYEDSYFLSRLMDYNIDVYEIITDQRDKLIDNILS